MLKLSDLMTFAAGLVAGVGWEVGDALVQSETLFTDTNAWITALGIGATAAAGRWVLTWLALRGFAKAL